MFSFAHIFTIIFQKRGTIAILHDRPITSAEFGNDLASGTIRLPMWVFMLIIGVMFVLIIGAIVAFSLAYTLRYKSGYKKGFAAIVAKQNGPAYHPVETISTNQEESIPPIETLLKTDKPDVGQTADYYAIPTKSTS